MPEPEPEPEGQQKLDPVSKGQQQQSNYRDALSDFEEAFGTMEEDIDKAKERADEAEEKVENLNSDICKVINASLSLLDVCNSIPT